MASKTYLITYRRPAPRASATFAAAVNAQSPADAAPMQEGELIGEPGRRFQQRLDLDSRNPEKGAREWLAQYGELELLSVSSVE